MRRLVAVTTGIAILMMVSSAQAQTPPMTPPPSSESHHPGTPEAPGRQSRAPMMGHEMMGGMMCPMMGPGMMGGGPGMGGMSAMSDPKAMARMLKLRGDMMKAMGDVMLKHAQALEQEK